LAVEGAGSYGAGLARMLVGRGEWMVEVDRPSRPARRGGKTDALDTVRAAQEALAQQHLAAPRRRGDRQALRVLLATRQGAVTVRLHHQPAQGVIVGAPQQRSGGLLRRAAGAAGRIAGAPQDRPGVAVDRPTGSVPAAEVGELEGEVGRLVRAVAP
jgi:hypothetical protein